MPRPTYVHCSCNAGGYCGCLDAAQAKYDREERNRKRLAARDVIPPGKYSAKIINIEKGVATFVTNSGYKITATITSHRHAD